MTLGRSKTHRAKTKTKDLNNYSDQSMSTVVFGDKDPGDRIFAENFEVEVNFCRDLGRNGRGLGRQRLELGWSDVGSVVGGSGERGGKREGVEKCQRVGGGVRGGRKLPRGLEKILKIKGKSVNQSSPKGKQRKIINADELEFKISDRTSSIPQNRIDALEKFPGQQSELLIIRPIKKTKNLTGNFESFHTNDENPHQRAPPSTAPQTSYRKSKIHSYLAEKLRKANPKTVPKYRFGPPLPNSAAWGPCPEPPPKKKPYSPNSLLNNKDEILKYFQIHKIDTSLATHKDPYGLLSMDS